MEESMQLTGNCENIRYSLKANPFAGEMAQALFSNTFYTLTLKKVGQLLVRESSYVGLYSELC